MRKLKRSEYLFFFQFLQLKKSQNNQIQTIYQLNKSPTFQNKILIKSQNKIKPKIKI